MEPLLFYCIRSVLSGPMCCTADSTRETDGPHYGHLDVSVSSFQAAAAGQEYILSTSFQQVALQLFIDRFASQPDAEIGRGEIGPLDDDQRRAVQGKFRSPSR